MFDKLQIKLHLLKILIVPSWYFEANSRSISGIMFHHHAKALRDSGIDAEIWFGKVSPSQSIRTAVISDVEDSVPTTRFSSWAPPRLNTAMIRWGLEKYATGLEKHIEQHGLPGIIHAQGYLAASAVAILHKRKPFPFIYTERSSVWLTGNVPGRMLSWVHGALSRADVITCVSPGLQRSMSIQTKREIKVIPPWFDESIFYPAPTIPDTPFTWITAGEPSEIKGLPVIIEAFAEFVKHNPGTPVKLIFADEIKDKQNLITLCQSKNISELVHFAGLLSSNQLADLMRSSHVYISASKYETFGKSMAEAQACGLPLISTPTAGGTFIIDSTGSGILTTDHSATSLYQAMQSVFDQYGSYRHKSISHRAAVFSKKQILPEWIQVYSQLAG